MLVLYLKIGYTVCTSHNHHILSHDFYELYLNFIHFHFYSIGFSALKSLVWVVANRFTLE